MNKQYQGWRFWVVQSLTVCRGPFMFLAFVITGLSMIFRGNLSLVWFLTAEGLIVVSAVSDAFDGKFARKFEMVTRFGKNIDPLMDKLFYQLGMVTICLLAMQLGQIVHAWWLGLLTLFFLARDLWVTILRAFVAMHPELGMDSAAGKSGKWRTIISFPMVCVVYTYLAAPLDWKALPVDFYTIVMVIVYGGEIAAALVTGYSLCDYTKRYKRCVQKELSLQS